MHGLNNLHLKQLHHKIHIKSIKRDLHIISKLLER